MIYCKGFAKTRLDYDNNRIMETLYAVLPTGLILESDEMVKSNCFGQGRIWSPSFADFDTVREMSEFIGNYPVPEL